MKIYSLSFSIVAVTLLGTLLNLPEAISFEESNHSGDHIKRHHVIHGDNAAKLFSSLSDGYSGDGYHNYGSYTLDVSGLPDNSDSTIYWNSYTIPNRFALHTPTYTSETGWQGASTWSGPWGPGNLTTSNSGSLTINKGTYSTVSLIVDSCNSTPSSGNETWDVSY